MSRKLDIYNLLVNRVPGIRERYHKIRDNPDNSRVRALVCLLGLNISYYVFQNKKLRTMEKYPYYESKLLCSEKSESELSHMQAPAGFAGTLLEYDVISFDVFDTLLFRPFSKPTDLFYIFGHRLSYPDFKNIRIFAERKARKLKEKNTGHSEVTIDEIYAVLAGETGLDAGLAETEVSLEEEFCFANPYMLEVVRELRKTGKRLVITSDMYLNENQIRQLLETAGFLEFDAYYVSCEYGKSKSRGDLYEIVKEKEQAVAKAALSIAHIGDNAVSDVRHAKDHGFIPFYYKNINNSGKAFRPDDMSAITGSVYRGLVDAYIHNGLHVFSREYEYGYIYGGLFVTGYCMFIHDYVKENSIDKILFLSRDGYILKQVYELLYPDENNTEYVYWSRTAAMKLTASRFKYDFFRRFLYHNINQGITLEKVFGSMDLEKLLPELCAEIPGFSSETVLKSENVGEVKKFLDNNWQRILDSYDDQITAAGQYYTKVFKGTESAAAVDIGWAGSGAIMLNYMVNNVWNLNCSITGLIAGGNSCSDSDPDFSETFIQSGKIVSYLYSQNYNRDIWKFHDPCKGHNLFLETLLDAPHGSLHGFYLNDEGQCVLKFKEDSNDKNMLLEIQRGILDFAVQWKAVSPKLADLNHISGRDAYAPFIIMESDKNHAFMKKIFPLLDDAGI